VLKICTHALGTTRKTPFLIVVARWSPGGRLVFSGAGAGGFVVAGGLGLVVGLIPGATQALNAAAVTARVNSFTALVCMRRNVSEVRERWPSMSVGFACNDAECREISTPRREATTVRNERGFALCGGVTTTATGYVADRCECAATAALSSPPVDVEGGGTSPALTSAPRLFISYRRDDTSAFVAALDRRLRQDMGSRNVFRDVHDLIAGERFEVRLTDEIEHSDIVLVVIGPQWEGAGSGTSAPRLARDDDFVRLEVRTALEHRPRTTPMPVLVDGATFPTVLPGDIEAIKEHHSVTLEQAELERRNAPGYQALLVGTWVARAVLSRTV
jgi:hypothetical protein